MSRKSSLPPLDEDAISSLKAQLEAFTAKVAEAPVAAPSPVDVVAQQLALVPAPPETEFGAYVRPEWRELAVLRIRSHKNKRECAFELGVSTVTISMWIKKPLYQAYESWLSNKYLDSLPIEVRRKHQEVKQKFDDEAGEMQDRLLEILNSTSDNKLAASIAQDWLDRSGHGPVKSTQRTILHQFSDEKLAELFNRAREIEQPIEGEVVKSE